MLKVLGVNLAILAVLLAGLELAFGTWFSDVHALHAFTKPRDMRLVRPNPLPEGPETIVYTRDANGLRGLNGPVGAIDILTVGGSTTDQRFLDDADTFQAEMRRLSAAEGRPLVIANAGIDGQTTFGHIQNFASWFSRIEGMRARVILFYVGTNDLMRLDENAAYDRTEAEGPLLRLQLLVREKSALYQMYRIAGQMLSRDAPGHLIGLENNAVAPPWAEAPLLPDMPDARMRAALTALSGRIETLARLARDFGAEPVFVTQRSAAWRRLEDGRVVGVERVRGGFHAELTARYGAMNGLDLHRAERLTADAILAGCRASGALCLDLMAGLDLDPAADFYDPVHVNAAGARKVGRWMLDALRARMGDRLFDQPGAPAAGMAGDAAGGMAGGAAGDAAGGAVGAQAAADR